MRYSSILSVAARVVRDSRPNLFASKNALVLSPRAVQRIRELFAENQTAAALRIGVQQRGCNGYTYTMEYAQSKGKFDEEVVQDDVKVWVDPKAQLTLLGSEMDYEENQLASEFVFKNPNIKGTCGCGESFNI
ncbi:iron-sulfur cluster biosynthesis domain-containing protein [Ditylenchus destructor]|uniref:Iron-sulfur cluster assembly 1 homolog, mitochondrial n=1 Tax=Ditylenchus destructor TaxID=166010 RepID=A0AAD4NBP5_9BILA|nr:iron-sulfur cluster biosynthesis domain-containing protein [Ditylenchus destructor]